MSNNLKNYKPESFTRGNHKVGVLFFHGWSSTNYDLLELAQYLDKKGVSLRAPMFIGHGTQPEDLRSVHYRDWLDQAEGELSLCQEMWDEVYVGGISMGGQVALYLAQKHDNIVGIVSVGTPIFMRLSVITRMLTPVLRYVKVMIKKRYFIKNERVIKIATSRPGYKVYPLNSATEVLFLTKKIRKLLPLITIPALLIQSKTDHLLNLHNIEYFYNKLGSQHKQKMLIEDSYHVVLVDHKKHYVFKGIYEFIKKHSTVLNK